MMELMYSKNEDMISSLMCFQFSQVNIMGIGDGHQPKLLVCPARPFHLFTARMCPFRQLTHLHHD